MLFRIGPVDDLGEGARVKDVLGGTGLTFKVPPKRSVTTWPRIVFFPLGNHCSFVATAREFTFHPLVTHMNMTP
jgi:hypothetical protein